MGRPQGGRNDTHGGEQSQTSHRPGGTAEEISGSPMPFYYLYGSYLGWCHDRDQRWRRPLTAGFTILVQHRRGICVAEIRQVEASKDKVYEKRGGGRGGHSHEVPKMPADLPGLRQALPHNCGLDLSPV